jgi:hypothetical protein
MNPTRSRLLKYLAAGAMASAGLVAQTTTGNLTVTVTDAQGHPVAGARIELRSNAMNGSRTGTTDAAGVFRAPLLPPGGYSGTVVKDGFKPQGIQAVVPLNGSTTVAASMSAIQEATAVVEILGSQSKVDKSEVQFKENFLQENILELPVGRNLSAITEMAPGVTDTGNGPVINGAASYENKYLVDGTDINDNFFNSDDGLFIEDAIAETAILQNNVSAEYGRFTGGVINAITKTGTNEFSGSMRAAMNNPAWSATKPGQDRHDDSFKSKLGTTYTFTVGGPILKDKLWYFVAGRFVSRSDQNTTLPGYLYTTKQDQKRYEGNIAWQISNDNRVQATYIRRTIDIGPTAPLSDYTAGLDSLSNRGDTYSLLSLSWDSILTDWMNLSVKTSQKKHHITTTDVNGNGGTAFWQSPVFDVNTFFQFNNHYFSDDPEDRDNRNISATLSMFLHGAGEHALKMGVEHFQEIDNGTNGQSPTGYDINTQAHFTYGTPGPVTYDFDPLYSYLDDWTKAPGGTFTSSYDSAYINDNWTVDKHLNLSLGLRFERYSGSGPAGYLTPTVTSIVPRLGLNLDPIGDGSWQASLTYAQYSGKANAAVTTLGTTVGNPALYDYAYIGPAVAGVSAGPGVTGFQRSDYGTVPTYVSDPSLNVRLSPDLKTPLTTEFTIGLTHKIGARGDWTLRYISRNYTRMFEDYKGDQGVVTEPLSGAQYSVIVWGNTTDQNASRTYKSLQATYEDTFNLWGGSLFVFGNYTYSWLRGNYEGDGGNSPGGGTQIGDFPGTEPGGVAFGYLPNDEPQRLKANALWSHPIGLNKLTLGFNYDRASGHPYSISRTVYYPDPGPYPDGTTSYTQYYKSQRGTGGRFPTTDSLNFSAQWDGQFSRSSKIGYFVKLTVFNALNHIEKASYNTHYDYVITDPALPWVQGGLYGTTADSSGNQNSNYFVGARRFIVDAGFKF